MTWHLELCFDTSDISSNPFGLFPILIWNWFVSSSINIHNHTITRCRNIFATRGHLLLQFWPQGKLQECLFPHLAACAVFSGGSNPPGKDKILVKCKSSNLALKLCNITPLSPERNYINNMRFVLKRGTFTAQISICILGWHKLTKSAFDNNGT